MLSDSTHAFDPRTGAISDRISLRICDLYLIDNGMVSEKSFSRTGIRKLPESCEKMWPAMDNNLNNSFVTFTTKIKLISRKQDTLYVHHEFYKLSQTSIPYSARVKSENTI